MYLLTFIKPMTNLPTYGATSLADIDLRRTYKAIDCVATGRIPSLFCANMYIYSTTVSLFLGLCTRVE